MRWRNSGRTTGDRQCEWPGCQYAKAMSESEYCIKHRKDLTAEEEACRVDIGERIDLFRQAHEDGTLADLVELCLADPPALPIFRLVQLKKALDKAGASEAWQKMLEDPRPNVKICACGSEIEWGGVGRPAKACRACRVERDAQKLERKQKVSGRDQKVSQKVPLEVSDVEREARAMLERQLIG